MRFMCQVVVVMLSMFIQPSLHAANNLLFQGTLIDTASCSVNNDQRIDVDFGARLGISQIDGVNYRQAINYQITCTAGVVTPDMTMLITATAMNSDDTAIQSDKNALGIRLLQNGTPLVLNQKLTFAAANPPLLEAVPVTSDQSLLTEGAFIAMAAIQVEYQ